MASNVKTLRSSITDGIALVPRYRERQLSSLHRTLVAKRQELLQGLVDALNFTRNEALAEYLQVLNSIKTYHATCDPLSCNETEYAIARSEDYLDRRMPAGYVHVIPADESLYNTIVPVAAAITAGNVVLLQRSSRKTPLASQMEHLLTEALSVETYACVERDPFDPKYQQSRGVVFEGKSAPSAASSTRRICCPNWRVAAVVDRSADIKSAARDLVRARFSFGGLAAYAPDLILVNDFKIKEFCEAVADAGLRYLSQTFDASVTKQSEKSANGSEKRSEMEQNGTILMSGNRGKVVLLHSNTSVAFEGRLNAPTLLVLPVSSMDDAIDLLNKSEYPLAANYVYAAPASAKYVTQFIRSATAFVNHVPVELLIGGSASTGSQPSAHPRYTAEMFSQPSPIELRASERSRALTSLVMLSDTKQQRKFEKALDASLTPVKEPWGPMFGFFEQGFLFNAGVILSSVVVGTVCGIKYGYPAIVSSFQ